MSATPVQQLLEPLAGASPSSATSDDAVQAAVQGFNDLAQQQYRPHQQQDQEQEQKQDGGDNTATAAGPASSALGDFLWDAFGAVFKAVGRTPAAQQGKLLDFLTQLQAIKATDNDGKTLKHEDGEVWNDLPSFGWVARDLWNFDANNLSAEDRAKVENWTAFLAQLTARSASGATDSPFDFSTFALWAMRDAFETNQQGAASQPAARLAALWVRFAGDRLRQLSVDATALSGRLGAPAGKYAEREWKGFNEDRWNAWGEELKAAQNQYASDDTIEQAVKHVVGL
ncbi:uncharacterized protein C8A04DRAFT_12886 [Dichotomopilus funicola]|uniref:Uncharacterized protein n=1 Tax=Dichotomopilus funicola TaxID=1934379 RepID=A0AAN6ZMD2_9PEZI|nr:hypothetical protein C8A04DRAFT_12886 [Dichotomopilus funicola]